MSNFFVRQSAAYRNDLNRSLGALLGIAQGLICHAHLCDKEVRFLDDWLTLNEAVASEWPGDVVVFRVKEALRDGVITAEERAYLTHSLQQLIGGSLEDLASSAHVSQLAIDTDAKVKIEGSLFCLTGDFVFAPRSHCEQATMKRGGAVHGSVTKKLHYLVVGGLGSKEWKHGSFGTKIQKAVEYKRKGLPILIVHEDQWAQAL